jgi:subtilase family serine protease
MAWGENIGWINLSPASGGVTNNGTGNLSGYAWGENIGWINFAPTGGGVTINPNTGIFNGYAWGENVGWINFAPTGGGVTTSWRQAVNTYTLTLSTAGTGSGTVSGVGTYTSGQTATVSATANSGSTFSGWSGPDGAECTSGSVLMNADKSCTATFTLIVSQPDLVMTAVAPNSATVNQGGTLSVTDTVQNQGPVKTPIGFRVGFHLSVNNIYGDEDDVVIITNRPVAALATGASSTGTTSLLIHSTTPSGVYYVCAKADSLSQIVESDETNNTLCSSNQVTVPPPDLLISALSTTTTTANAGGVAMVTNAITNQGGSKAGTFIVAFHLSTNAVYGDGDDIVLTTTRTIGLLGVGATSSATNALQIPLTIPAGSYFICANADDGNSVAESEEGNNAACTATTVTVPPPDLVMTALSKAAGTVAQGGSFAVSSTVKNQGGSSAGAFAIGLVLSSDSVIGNGDDIAMTPQRSVSGLGVGLSSNASTTVTVPGGTTPGIYYIGAIADVNGVVAEGNEGNNTRLATGTITVTP